MPVRNHKITFLKRKSETDEIGQTVEKWETSGHSALASISSVSGKLYYEAARNNDEATVLFKFHYLSWMSELNKIDFRIQYDNKTYEIKHISDIKERHREIELRGVSVNV